TLNPYFLNKSSCTEMYWVPPEALDRLTRASVNDTITTPCIGGGQSTITFEGASGGSATDILSLDPAAGPYAYDLGPATNVTVHQVDCDGNISDTTLPNFPMWPGSNWPQTPTLPSNIEPLGDNDSFQASTAGFYAPAMWDLSFTLDPTYDCKPCKQNGG